ncbi:phage tail assembly chaperone GT [Macrococcus brunensis]|uniref:phage tail assembly chaperone GT n=1 Tax=Macrococcus brunensis TaxID=198483 RepID=UPI003C7AE0CA
MDAFFLHSMKRGKDINDLLDMPYHFVIKLLEQEVEGAFMTDEEQDALLAAL